MKFVLVLWSMLLCSLPALTQDNIQWEPLYEPGSGGRMTGLEISPHDRNHVIVTGDMLGVGVSFDGADSWQLTYGLASYECGKPTFHPTDPNVVWLATLSGPYVSYDRGVNWLPRRNGMGEILEYDYSAPIERILISPGDPTQLWAFGGSQRNWGGARDGSDHWGAVWKSDDGGDSWRKLSTVGEAGQDRYGIIAACFGGASTDTLYAALYQKGVYGSFDGGQSWNRLIESRANQNAYYVAAHPANSQVVYAAMGNYFDGATQAYVPGAILASEDAGKTWEKRVQGLPQNVGNSTNQTAKYEVVRVSASNPNVLFTSNTSWSKAGLFISTDGGRVWEETANQSLDKAYPAGRSMEVATIAPQDHRIIMAAGAEYILRTTNGGANWDDATSVRPSPDSEHWRGRGYSGLVSRDFAFHPTRDDVSAFAAMDGGNCWISTDDRYSWHARSSDLPNWGGGNALSFTSSTSVFVTLGQGDAFEGIARSSDLGMSWTILYGSDRGLPDKDANDGRAYKVYALPQDSSKVWAVIGQKLYHSGDYGENWTVVFAQATVNHFDVVDGTIYLATDQGVYRGADATFELVADPGFPVTFCRVDPRTGSIYVCGWRKDGGGLWRWDGESWTALIEDAFIRSLDIHPYISDELIASTDDDPFHDLTNATGIYFTQDGGATWTRETSGLAMLRGQVVKYNPHNPDEFIFGAGGRGFFRGTRAGSSPTRISNGTVLQAEDYDTGGQEAAYYDSTPNGNSGRAYRNEGVDIKQFAPEEYYVGWITPGEWLDYAVDITAGTYDIAVPMASPNDGRTLRLALDGHPLGTLDCPASSTSWTDFRTATLTNVDLPAGRHTLRLEMVDGSFNVDKLTFTLTSTTPASVNQTIALRSVRTGKYVSADLNDQDKPLTASWAAEARSWERFELLPVQDGRVALLSTASGQYVATENNRGDKILRANRNAIGSWEQYEWIDNTDGTVSLRANANGKYVAVMADGALRATGSEIGTSTKFNWILDSVRTAATTSGKTVASALSVSAPRFSVYPNPARDQLTITADRAYQFTLYDASGRALLRGRHGAGTSSLDVSDLAPGIYQMQLHDGTSGKLQRRIIIQ